MYKSFGIKNFRCFKEVKLEPLERLNLITGKNNAGKTSFLEALFLHVGPNNPDLPLRVNVFRGMEFISIEPKELWGSLFFDKDIDWNIELTSIDERDEKSILKITIEEAEESFITPPTSDTPTTAPPEPQMSMFPGPRDLKLSYENGSGRTGIARASITPQGEIKIKHSALKPKCLGVFLPARQRFLRADADRYSALDRKGKTEQLLNTMRLLEPRLRRLAVLSTSGFPLINGDIGLNELLPVPLMGEGMVRLLSILLAIYATPGGIVLIDEIENGLHYSIIEKVWEAIAQAARQSNAQIFATTHSIECVLDAHKSFSSSNSYDFLYHRFSLSDGEIKIVTYDQKKLETAITTGLEVR